MLKCSRWPCCARSAPYFVLLFPIQYSSSSRLHHAESAHSPCCWRSPLLLSLWMRDELHELKQASDWMSSSNGTGVTLDIYTEDVSTRNATAPCGRNVGI